MKNTRLVSCIGLAVGAVLALAATSSAAQFSVTNLVTDDQAANPARITDVGLVNAWGLSYPATGPFWISSNGTGTADLYAVNPATQNTVKQALTVTIPGDGSVTGQVFNGNAAAAFGGDLFLFVSEDGTVSGWRGALGSTAEALVSGSAANVYKGAAFATTAGSSYLYAANFRAGSIDVDKGSAASPSLTGAFVDPLLPSGFAPFNIQNLGGTLYVTYAKQDGTKHDEIAGAGLGLVDSYDLQGNLLARIATGGTLNAPWGLAIAPSSFGALAGALLVGNFGDGRINAYDVTTHAFLGQILDLSGSELTIDGLWAIAPGNNGNAGSSALLYFTAGPDDESHGVFGVLTPVPEPSVALLLMAGLLGLAARRARPATRYRARGIA
ncbi:MAG: TIGR03118 family protein [Caldimonas sp.]